MLPGAAASPVPTGRDDGTGQPPQAASLQQGVASAAGQEALLARCKLIFLGDSFRASGLCAVASPSTLGAILAAELAANALWKTHEAQVRQRFAPVLVAKQEVFGYLLNDIAGKQLLHSDYAMPVGQRGDNAVAKAKSQLKLKRRHSTGRHCVGLLLWRRAAPSAPLCAQACSLMPGWTRRAWQGWPQQRRRPLNRSCVAAACSRPSRRAREKSLLCSGIVSLFLHPQLTPDTAKHFPNCGQESHTFV